MSEENDTQAEQAENSEQSTRVGKTIFYAAPREALTAEDVKTIRTVLESEGYFLQKSSDGNNVMIKREEGTDPSNALDAL